MPLVIGNALTISGGITVTSVVLSGDQLYDTPGTYSWTAPDGVRSVSVVCIGGGGAGSRGDSPSVNQVRTGGGGGGLGWKNNIPVEPGQMYQVQVGAGGTQEDGYDGQDGTASFFISANVVAGLGGQGGGLYLPRRGSGGGYVGDGGGTGGRGSYAPKNPLSASNTYPYTYAVGGGSGGSTAGYSGNGGNAGTDGSTTNMANPRFIIVPTAGSGGGAGGSWNATPTNFAANAPSTINYSYGAGSGGSGTGVYGQGFSGGYWKSSTQEYVFSGSAAAYGVDAGTVGQPGSGGGPMVDEDLQAPGVGPGFGAVGKYDSNSIQRGGDGGLYGGGGGAVGPDMIIDPSTDRIGHGGGGAVRIIWGDGRSFPNNAGFVSMRNLLSAQGQISYDAAQDNDWFTVSAQDYGNVRAGIVNTVTTGVSNEQLVQTPDGTLAANRWYSLPSTLPNGSSAMIPNGNFIIGFAIRPYQLDGSSWTFQPYWTEAYQTPNVSQPYYAPFGSPLTVQGTSTIYWLRKATQGTFYRQFMYYGPSDPDSASLSWASVSGFQTGANGVAYALYEPWLGGWTPYSPGLGIVAQWLYTGGRYQW